MKSTTSVKEIPFSSNNDSNILVDSSESRICLSRFVPGFPLSGNLQLIFCQAARRSKTSNRRKDEARNEREKCRLRICVMTWKKVDIRGVDIIFIFGFR
jgi:hypothetical protein